MTELNINIGKYTRSLNLSFFRILNKILSISRYSVREILEEIICFISGFYIIVQSPMAFVSQEAQTYESLANVLSKTLPFVYITAIVLYLLFFGIEKRNLPLLFVPITYLFLLIFDTYGGYRGSWILAFSGISSFLLLSRRMQRKCFYSFYVIVQVINVIGILLFILYWTGGKELFSHIPIYYSKDPANREYIRLGIFAMVDYSGFTRMCGIFNEAGALGTVCAFLFFALYKKTSWWEKLLLLVSGFLTISFAFYLLTFMYICLRLLLRNPRNIVWLFLLGVLFTQIPNIKFSNKGLQKTVKRFSLNDDNDKGLLKGDNRTSEIMDRTFDRMLDSDDMLFGYGYGGIEKERYRSLGIKVQLCEFGILGLGIYILVFSIGGLYLGTSLSTPLIQNIECCIYIFLYLVSLYQRPYLSNLFAYILFYGGILSINSRGKRVNTIIQ